MNPIPLVVSFGLLCFCITGPVHPYVLAFTAFVFGWYAALQCATRALQ